MPGVHTIFSNLHMFLHCDQLTFFLMVYRQMQDICHNTNSLPGRKIEDGSGHTQTIVPLFLTLVIPLV